MQTKSHNYSIEISYDCFNLMNNIWPRDSDELYKINMAI